MATPDPSTLTSSSQIFSANHTLPQIRAIHKNIHVQIEEKASRLRTQVGSSYRELLGTADTIVHMRDDNDAVQELLGRMGGRCGRTVIGAKASGLSNFVKNEKNPAAKETARLRLLDSCSLAVGRILKGGGGLSDAMKKGDRLVLATKVLILIRLLVKNLAEDANDSGLRKTIEAANTTFTNLRRRLLRNVEKVLERAGEDEEREDVLKALCAYSLVNSSGARDVVRHFLHVRAAAMTSAFETEEHEREKNTDDVVRSLKLYSRTLLDVQALVPLKLSSALANLKSHPLLADSSLKQLEGLRLDVYQRWCSEEIKYYTPFIRHDDLDGKSARDMLMDWSEKGTEVLLNGLKKTLGQMSEFKSIMELRTKVLQLWIRDGGRTRGIDPTDMQDELREAINARMLAVIETKVSKLRLVSSDISSTLAKWKSGITDEHCSLWDDEGYDAALSNGAGPFVQEVVSRLYGRNDAVSKTAHCYKSWYQIIGDVKAVVESLRKQRWDNDYDEIEDEETIEARQQLLSKDDPQMLQQKLDTTLDESFKELEKQIQKLWEGQAQEAPNGPVAIYFLRVLRDIRYELPDRPTLEKFGLDLVPALHSTIATTVSESALDEFSSSYLTQRTIIGRPLWEGEPALPSQPSPAIFQFLRNLSHSMSDTGVDLWTSAAVKVLKQHLSQQLCEKWLEAIASVLSEAQGASSENEEQQGGEKKKKKKKPAKGKSDGSDDEADEEEKGDEEEKTTEKDSAETSLSTQQTHEIFTQWLFDIALLRCCIGGPVEGIRDEFKSLEEMVYERTKLEDGPARQRIIKSSREFWQRTSLLFGLLA